MYTDWPNMRGTPLELAAPRYNVQILEILEPGFRGSGEDRVVVHALRFVGGEASDARGVMVAHVGALHHVGCLVK